MDWSLEFPLVVDVRVPAGWLAAIDYRIEVVTMTINGLEMRVPMKVPVLRALLRFGEEIK